jgi:pilus assembly protein CpaB
VPRRSVAVLVALALAVIASAAAYSGLHSAQTKADRNATLTSVYVLKGVVPQNESAAAAYLQGLIKTTRIPFQLVPPGAVTQLSVIRNQEAQYNLPPGEVVIGAMFVTPKTSSGLAAQTVPKGDVAVSVSVDQVHGVAGLIQPGDKVDILVDLQGDLETSLYQLVPVLAVGTTLVPAPGASSATRQTKAAVHAKNVITFAVPPAAAARIAAASSGGEGVTGSLYLTLVAPNTEAASPTSVTGTNLVPGSPTGAVTSIIGASRIPPGQTNESHDSTP